MPASAHAGSFNITTADAGNTVEVTGVGFQPKCIIFFWNGRTAAVDGSGLATHQRGFGWVTDTTLAAVTSRSLTGNGTAETSSAHSDAACILEVDGTPATNGVASVDSFDLDGFTVHIDTAFTADYRVHYLALGGDSLTNAKSVSFAPAGVAPTTQDVTGFGFDPDLALFIGGSSQLSLLPDADIDSQLCFGVARATDGEWVWVGGSNHSPTTMQTMAYALRGECIARFNSTIANITDRAEFAEWITDGVRINWVERNTGGHIFCLGLKGLSSAVGLLLTETDTVTGIATSDGFAPAAGVFLSAGRGESTADTPTDHDRFSMGVASSATARSAIATHDEDGVGTSEVTTASEFDAVYANVDTSDAVVGLMDVVAFGADGIDLIMDDADPAENAVFYLALGPAADAAAPRRFVLHG